MPFVLLQVFPSSIMLPRQSTTVPNVSNTSALGTTVGEAAPNAGRISTAAPIPEIFKKFLRFISADYIPSVSVRDRRACWETEPKEGWHKITSRCPVHCH